MSDHLLHPNFFPQYLQLSRLPLLGSEAGDFSNLEGDSWTSFFVVFSWDDIFFGADVLLGEDALLEDVALPDDDVFGEDVLL